MLRNTIKGSGLLLLFGGAYALFAFGILSADGSNGSISAKFINLGLLTLLYSTIVAVKLIMEWVEKDTR